jgi:hypothetical protein
MAKKIRVILIILGALGLLACVVLVWALNSPEVGDYYWMRKRGTDIDLAFAFAIALRRNDPAAYEMIDPSLRPRLDEWMNTHQGWKCINKPHTTLIGNIPNEGFHVAFGCSSDSRADVIFIRKILIENMRVVGWGEVIEDFGDLKPSQVD